DGVEAWVEPAPARPLQDRLQSNAWPVRAAANRHRSWRRLEAAAQGEAAAGASWLASAVAEVEVEDVAAAAALEVVVPREAAAPQRAWPMALAAFAAVAEVRAHWAEALAERASLEVAEPHLANFPETAFQVPPAKRVAALLPTGLAAAAAVPPSVRL